MNKKIIFTIIIIICIVLIVGDAYFKMKYDEKKESEAKYYDEQEKKITLFLKYNMKDFRGIKFTEYKRNPMGNFVFKGYVNDDKNKNFTATAYHDDDYQFEGTIGWSEGLSELEKVDLKSVSEIKKEEKNKKDEN
ncbi:DUF1433 domain-containing protein [Staphylococcus epidermidis]|uniref:DUF1433 domain-containing protein n=2 Tax=Staphylococcus epidermidis TaxID=1282 RepID=UPI000743A9A0|nr:DUF1433 domain-containing protein [Staphylococcus epidermidis]